MAYKSALTYAETKRRCKVCAETKPIFEFAKKVHKYFSDMVWFSPVCKQCAPPPKPLTARGRELKRASVRRYAQRHPHSVRLKAARRNAAKIRAVPAWADHDKIKTVYRRAEALGFHVDHIVPLASRLVCGLHTWENLQLLEARENQSKYNKSWPDMPGVSA